MQEIYLPNVSDYVAVDDCDYEELNVYRWRLKRAGGHAYVIRTKVVSDKCVTVVMARVITSAPKGVEVAHLNGDPLDNRRSNLRLVHKACFKIGRSSRYRGVSFEQRTKKYRAQIRVNGKIIGLGRFSREVDAAMAYNKAAFAYYGTLAWLNDLTDNDVQVTIVHS